MKNYLVIGLGKFGKTIAKTLSEYGNIVLALDSSEELIQQIIDEGIIEDGIILDVTDENAMRNIIKDDYEAAFVCIGSNIQGSILATLILKDLGIKNIICKAKTKIQAKVLEKVGATKIVFPEELMGEKIAKEIMKPTILEVLKFSEEYSIFELKTPNSFVNKNLMELDLREKYLANVIAIRSSDGNLNVTPKPSDALKEDDTMVIIGKTELIDKMK